MVRSQQPFLEPGTAFADYEVQAVIGRGGMGVVYQARDVRLDRRVALKLLAPEFTAHENFRARFLRESRLAAAVDHPNIIPIYEAGDADGQLFIAMRYVPGVDLRRELDERSRLERAEALALLQQLADALDAAHEAGLVHRDVKPANVLLADRSGHGRRHAYLTDFGLTRRSASISGLTTTGHFLGTLDYVAPEQIRGETVDGRADVYSFACLAYATLVGRPPFDQEDDVALMWAHLSLAPPRAAELRPELAGAVDDALAAGLAKSAADRPDSCGELVALMDGRRQPRPAAPAPGVVPVPTTRLSVPPPGTSAPGGGPAADGWSRPDEPLTELVHVPAGATARGGRTRRRRAWPLVAVALTAVAAVLAGWLLSRDGEEPWTTFAGDGVPYTLEVPADWEVHRHEAGDSTVTVLSPTDLRGLFGDDPQGPVTAAAAVRSDPQAVVGVAVYHRPRLEGDSAEAQLQASQALLPGQGGQLRPGTRVRAGDLEATAMTGDLVLAGDVSLQLRVLVVDSTPRQLLVFFAPPAAATELADTVDRVAASLTTPG
ncbi:serine/threonine-protein kinase [Modestobacter versicolor]|uniref:serine/threonine-protein kinase n=1 Tax=Modestobacter versicolor TaxID=429133 RepID=UPI0034E00404